MNELIAAVLMLVGAAFLVVSALGLFRFDNLYMKLHAATKAGTLGAGLSLIGVGVSTKNLHSITEVILLILFIAITNPISAHLIAKLYCKMHDQDAV